MPGNCGAPEQGFSNVRLDATLHTCVAPERRNPPIELAKNITVVNRSAYILKVWNRK